MQIQTSQINTNGFKPKSHKKIYVVILLVVTFFLGAQYGAWEAARPDGESLIKKVFIDQHREEAPKTQNADWQLLWDVIDEINEKYVDRPVDMLQILYGAASGAVAALGDQYSVFLPPKEALEFQKELNGNFEGIGAEIAIKKQQLVVVTPLDDSPAIKAGIRAGDAILMVNGEDTAGMTIEEAVNKIRGPAGSQVNLKILHRGSRDPIDIVITRGKIEVKSLSIEIREVNGKKVGIMKLRRFGEETQKEMTQAISELLTANVQGVILDVRNNPGGFLDTAVAVASNWILEGQIVVVQKFGDGTENVFRAKGNNRLGTLPTVVLLNGGSASASEIVAGALHDHGLAILVGEKSFGKGSVQELIDLRDKAQVKLTIAKWLTPAGHDLNKEGLEPDEKVELTEDDFQNDRDPQLDRAIEILNER